MQQIRFKSTGLLHYSKNPYKVWVDVDHELARFYRNLIPFKINKPKYSPHISVVRNQIPLDLSLWAANEGKIVSFEYEPYIYNDELYYWINVFSEEIELIRIKLGIKPNNNSTYNKSIFHITLANIKNIGDPNVKS
jgi:hypothetical protein